MKTKDLSQKQTKAYTPYLRIIQDNPGYLRLLAICFRSSKVGTLCLTCNHAEGGNPMRAKGKMLGTVLAILFATAASQAQIDVLSGDGNAKAESEKVLTTADAKKLNTVVESKPIPFKTRYELSRTVGQGRIVKKQAGKPGELRVTYQISEVNGKTVKTKVETDRVEPVDELYFVGKSGYATSRGHYTRTKVLTMNASAYDPSAGRGKYATGRTKMGIRAGYGVVAVDPRVIPLGTMVYVEGYGIAYACDIGGAIKGNRIDLCLPTNAECIRFGRRKVRVHILK